METQYKYISGNNFKLEDSLKALFSVSNQFDNNGKEFLQPLLVDLFTNFMRIYQLTRLYESLLNDKKYSSNPILPDILRSCVVLAHATLEEFLRRLAINFSIKAGSKALKMITIDASLLLDSTNINEILKDAVIKKYEKHSTFNCKSDVVKLLENLNLNVLTVDSYLSQLESFFNRRHDIVHRLDQVGLPNQDERVIPDLPPQEVRKWLKVIVQFILDVVIQTDKKFFQNNVDNIVSQASQVLS